MAKAKENNFQVSATGGAGTNGQPARYAAGIDNAQDVWNTTLLTINDIISYIYRNPQAYPYNIIGSTLCTPFEQRFDSYMWGWAADMNIAVGNPQDMCVIQISDLEATGNEEQC